MFYLFIHVSLLTHTHKRNNPHSWTRRPSRRWRCRTSCSTTSTGWDTYLFLLCLYDTIVINFAVFVRVCLCGYVCVRVFFVFVFFLKLVCVWGGVCRTSCFTNSTGCGVYCIIWSNFLLCVCVSVSVYSVGRLVFWFEMINQSTPTNLYCIYRRNLSCQMTNQSTPTPTNLYCIYRRNLSCPTHLNPNANATRRGRSTTTWHFGSGPRSSRSTRRSTTSCCRLFFLHIFVCVYMCVDICTFSNTHPHRKTNKIKINTYTYVYTHKRNNSRPCRLLWTSAPRSRPHTFMCSYTHTHTHTHTHTNKPTNKIK